MMVHNLSLSMLKPEMILKRKKKTKPQLSSKDLASMVDLLSSRILHPWLCISSFRKLHTDMVHLLDSTVKFMHHMKPVSLTHVI